MKGTVPIVGNERYLTVQADYRKVQVPVDDIMYLTIDGRKTKITKADGTSIRTNRSLKDVFGDLPGEVFSSINRGIVVSKNYVKTEKSGLITMKDGTQFKRRVRADRTEKPKLTPASQEESWRACPASELDWWLGKLPMPVCILELVYRSRSGSAAFVVRYCNREMEALEGVKFSDVKDQTVTALKGIGSPKWLTIFADVAINGTPRMVEDQWENGSYYRVHCYQPQNGCCALVMTDMTRENNLVQRLFHRSAKG